MTIDACTVEREGQQGEMVTKMSKNSNKDRCTGIQNLTDAKGTQIEQ